MTVRKTVVLTGLAAAGAVALWLLVPQAGKDVSAPSEEVHRTARRIPESARKAAAPRVRPQADAVREEVQTGDGKMREDMYCALKGEDFKAAVKLAAQAVSSTNADVRSEALDMLAWFGEKSLPELTGFLSDPDERVRHTAFLHWREALGEIEDEKARVKVIQMTMRVLRDPETLEGVASELVGVDEHLAVEALSAMICTGAAAQAAQARRTYEFITGEKYVSKEQALARLAEDDEVEN